MKDIMVMPNPRTMTLGDDVFPVQNGIRMICANEDFNGMTYLFDYLKEALRLYSGVVAQAANTADDNGKQITFTKDEAVKPQGYTLKITADSVKITYKDLDGALYAAATLKQLLFQKGNMLPSVDISDDPDMLYRGIQMDISRDKIPTVQTIKRVIELCVDVKINLFMLYIEGYPIEFPSFPTTRNPGSQLTVADLKEIDQYCAERRIEFMANIQSFGHNGAWLCRPEFNQYAENPEGYTTESGSHGNPDMIALTTQDGVDFVDKMYADLLPAYSSPYLVVGGDETYEIGTGKSKEMADKIGVGKTYVTCLNRIYELARKHRRTMMYWGDIILKYPDLVSELSKDAIVMNWGYEFDHDYAGNTQTLKDAGVPFFVCPGTSSWNSMMGRTDNMLLNCDNAVYNGLQNGAMGLLMTDWGDGGHWQHLPISYAGYIYGTAVAWGYQNNKGAGNGNSTGKADPDKGAAVAEYLSRFVFIDETGQMDRLLMEIGNYSQEFAKRSWNNTYINMATRTILTDDSIFQTEYTYQSKEADVVAARADAFIKALDTVVLNCEDADLLISEFRNGGAFLEVCARFAVLRRQIFDGADKNELTEAMNRVQADLKTIQTEYKRIWLLRNLYSGLDDSLNNMAYIGRFE